MLLKLNNYIDSLSKNRPTLKVHVKKNILFSRKLGMHWNENSGYKQIVPRTHAALFEYMQFMRMLENNILQFIYQLFKAISRFHCHCL